ncbi:hypothetical protein JHK87_055896 [Glycine soja]|nr:hypothetical protein JHK87_055896 [Glycine soja]
MAMNHHTTNAVPTQWNPPTQGFFKCNFDSSIFKNENRFGYGASIRDHEGKFIKALTFAVQDNHHRLRLKSLLCTTVFNGSSI